ncbi:DoxX family protein [Nitrosospira sp. NpAV]|uniref:DoxX family protein n=1 Tax=Nitrosospira sp. NpAV TaxID=58133 RepID=UPI00069759F9|nr:DoxX family protein [Nitrosospira sp. NpAV]
MNSNEKALPALPMVGRLMMAAIFLISGFGKAAAPQMTIGYIASIGLPFPALVLAIAIGVEIIGGLMLALGYRTRIAALALATFTVAAGALFHNAIGDQTQFIMLLKNIAITGGLLQVAAFGAGAFSIDTRRGYGLENMKTHFRPQP